MYAYCNILSYVEVEAVPILFLLLRFRAANIRNINGMLDDRTHNGR